MHPYLAIDFGTSNCTAGMMQAGQPILFPLDGGTPYLSSAIFLPYPDSYDRDDDEQKAPSLAQLLRQRSDVLLGEQAHRAYSEDPLGGIFIRSPKSMLGSRLTPLQASLYQQVCSLMLSHIRRQAGPADAVLLGRPIHFQGIDGAEGDVRAEQMLKEAAQQAGFSQVAFAYEPVAAALEYESQLQQDQIVLVVDVGGGTTDISLLHLGPQRAKQADRSADLLAHAGRRLGGVDMDIKLAIYQLMPLFGRGSLAEDGKPLPAALFSDAVNIIDIQAQERFYQPATAQQLDALQLAARQPALLGRFRRLYRQHQSYALVQQAERAKIALASTPQYQLTLPQIDTLLSHQISAADFADAIYIELAQLRQLVSSCLSRTTMQPQQIFLTGGASQAPVIQQLLRELLPQLPLVCGDNFGSVGKGLCRQAERLFG